MRTRAEVAGSLRARWSLGGCAFAGALRVAAVSCVLILSACAGMRSPPLLAPEAQEVLLRDLSAFTLSGNATVISTHDSIRAGLKWTQDAGESRVRLSGTFAGSVTVTWQPGAVRLESSKGQRLQGAEAEQALVDELGFIPPFEALRYWVLGLEAPGEPAIERTTSDSGRIEELKQQQWRIRYKEWRNVRVRGGAVAVPRQMTVSRDDLRLTVIVRKWEL